MDKKTIIEKIYKKVIQQRETLSLVIFYHLDKDIDELLELKKDTE